MDVNKKLADYNFSVDKALAKYAQISVEESKALLKNMVLSDYISLIVAFDEQNEDEITMIIDKYTDTVDADPKKFSVSDQVNENTLLDFNSKKLEEDFNSFIREARLCDLLESDIFSNYSIDDIQIYEKFVPATIREAYGKVRVMTEDELQNMIGRFLKEDISGAKLYDLAIMYHITENLNPKLKSDIARIAKSTPNAVKAPSFTDPKTKAKSSIVSADPMNKTIATQNDKGEVSIHKVNNPNDAKQIALEAEDDGTDKVTLKKGVAGSYEVMLNGENIGRVWQNEGRTYSKVALKKPNRWGSYTSSSSRQERDWVFRHVSDPVGGSSGGWSTKKSAIKTLIAAHKRKTK